MTILSRAILIWLMTECIAHGQCDLARIQHKAAASQSANVEILDEHDNAIGRGVVIEISDPHPSKRGNLGLCATAKHVAIIPRLKIRYSSGIKSVGNRIAWQDADADLAVIEAWVPQDVVPMVFGDVVAGDKLSWPRGQSAAVSVLDDNNVFADVQLKPGDSGGGVYNESGQLIGIVSGGWFWTESKTTWPGRAGRIQRYARSRKK